MNARVALRYAFRILFNYFELANMESKLNDTLTNIRNSSLDALKLLYEISIPSELAPPASFWTTYTDDSEKLSIGLRACLVMWEVSGNKMVPNEFQLTATIALMSGQDCLDRTVWLMLELAMEKHFA